MAIVVAGGSIGDETDLWMISPYRSGSNRWLPQSPHDDMDSLLIGDVSGIRIQFNPRFRTTTAIRLRTTRTCMKLMRSSERVRSTQVCPKNFPGWSWREGNGTGFHLDV